MSNAFALRLIFRAEQLKALASAGNAEETSNDICRIIEILWIIRCTARDLDEASAKIASLTAEREILKSEVERTRSDLSSLITSLPGRGKATRASKEMVAAEAME